MISNDFGSEAQVGEGEHPRHTLKEDTADKVVIGGDDDPGARLETRRQSFE